MGRIGYCYSNLSLELESKNEKLLNNLDSIELLIYHNLLNLEKILKWNLENDFLTYRISEDIILNNIEYDLKNLSNFSDIILLLNELGKFIIDNNMRISFYSKLFDINHIEKFSEIMNYMNLYANSDHTINVNIINIRNNKKESMDRFYEYYNNLSMESKLRLTVKVDDNNLFTIKDLYYIAHEKYGIPVVFDNLKHMFNSEGISELNAIKICVDTWSGNIHPIVHISNSKKIFENSNDLIRESADYMYENFNNYGYNLDLELECNMRDIALLKYRKDFLLKFI